MVDASLFNALTAREYMDDKVMEAYLASKPGLLGAIGFRKIAESYDEVVKERDKAIKERDEALKKLKERDGDGGGDKGGGPPKGGDDGGGPPPKSGGRK